MLDKCCLCCPGTPELPGTCWLRTLRLLCTHSGWEALICCPAVLAASPLPCLVAFPCSWLSAGLDEFLPQTVLTFIYRAFCILLFPAHTSELSPAFIFPLWGSLFPSVQHHPQGCILAALAQLISKHFSVSLPVSEVWTTWRLSAGALIYCLRPFHYLNPHTAAAPILSSDPCSCI